MCTWKYWKLTPSKSRNEKKIKIKKGIQDKGGSFSSKDLQKESHQKENTWALPLVYYSELFLISTIEHQLMDQMSRKLMTIHLVLYL